MKEVKNRRGSTHGYHCEVRNRDVAAAVAAPAAVAAAVVGGGDGCDFNHESFLLYLPISLSFS